MNAIQKYCRSSMYLLILSIFCWMLSPGLGAQDAEIQEQIEAIYHEWDQAIAAKDLEKAMSFVASDFQAMGGMQTRENLKSNLESLFKNHEQIRSTVTVDEIRPKKESYIVFGDVHIETKTESDSEWTTLHQSGFLERFCSQDGELKICNSSPINKERFDQIDDRTYSDEDIGFSFAVPEDWSIYPVDYPTMQNTCMFLSPSLDASGIFGHVELPYNLSPQAAIEGDMSIVKKIMDDFHMIEEGETDVQGMKGYEILVRFASKEGDTFVNKRTYFAGGGLLYVFILNAEPGQEEWAGKTMETVLNTFSLSPESLESAADKARKKTTSGEVMEGIYTNEQFGCQIAVPQGWTIQTTPLGNFELSITMRPPEGKSLVRLLGVDTKGAVELGMVFDKELEGIQKITDEFEIHSETEDIELCDTNARTAVFSFSLPGLGAIKRKSVMLIKNNILYMLLCDAMPPEQYESMEASFEVIIQSLTIN